MFGSSALDGIDRVYAYRRIVPFPVYVGFGVDMPTREAEWAAAVLRDAALALFCMLVLGSATWFTWRSMQLRTAAAAALRAEADRRHMAETRLEQARSVEALGRMGPRRRARLQQPAHRGDRQSGDAGGGDAGSRPAGGGTTVAPRSEAGAELAGSLLAFARTQMLRIESARVDRLLREMRPLLQDLATAGIELRLDLPGELAACRCDVAQFRAAIGNLVSNARDAMPKGGSSRLRCTRQCWRRPSCRAIPPRIPAASSRPR
jgi:two-component system NtrC family sensor kinase